MALKGLLSANFQTTCTLLQGEEEGKGGNGCPGVLKRHEWRAGSFEQRQVGGLFRRELPLLLGAVPCTVSGSDLWGSHVPSLRSDFPH